MIYHQHMDKLDKVLQKPVNLAIRSGERPFLFLFDLAESFQTVQQSWDGENFIVFILVYI